MASAARSLQLAPSMNRAFALAGLFPFLTACDPSVVLSSDESATGGGGASTTSYFTTESTTTMGSTTTSDSTTTMESTTTSDSTTTTESTTTSSMATPCQDDENPHPPGTSFPSDCPCAPEAEALLPLLAQAALAHFESNGALCGSAFAVPASVPTGVGYQPMSSPGSDFLAGDAQNGWVCLDFTPPGGVHCRYRYASGEDFIAASVGGPEAVPGDFEVTAEGDDDGDGATSMFAIVGHKDPATGTFSLTPLFEHDPAD